ncbi:hypothetical protein [Nocardia sp. NPDC057668]|uniref:hypothetical protein n=1 Tax=Nocardia sp. NPDC057668 TaxID=3346202 RepID=UPI00366DEAF6
MRGTGTTASVIPGARTAFVALTGVLALTLAACGKDDTAPALPPLGPAVAPPTVRAEGPVPDSPALRAAILDAQALPDGYAALPDPAAGSTAGSGSSTDPAQCAKVLAPVAQQAPDAAARATATFGGLDFASIDIDAAAYAGDGAARAFTAVQTLLRDCGSYSGTDAADPSATIEFRVGSLEQPAAGDAATAYRVVTTSQGFTLYSAVSLALVGSTVVQIAMSGAKEPDAQQLSALTVAQVRKLRGESGP